MYFWLGSVLAGVVGLIILTGWLGSLRVMTPEAKNIRSWTVCVSFLGIFGGGTLAILQWASRGLNPDGSTYTVLSETGLFIAGIAWIWAFASWKTGRWKVFWIRPRTRTMRYRLKLLR